MGVEITPYKESVFNLVKGKLNSSFELSSLGAYSETKSTDNRSGNKTDIPTASNELNLGRAKGVY